MFVFIKEYFDNKEGAWAATEVPHPRVRAVAGARVDRRGRAQGCDKIRASIDAVAANEEVQAWQKKRPENAF